MYILIIILICVTLSLTIPAIVIAVRSAMATSSLERRVSALETTINAVSATQKTQLFKMTQIVTDLQKGIKVLSLPEKSDK